MKDSPHNKRLYRDLEEMEKLKRASDLIDFVSNGEPPNHYIVTYKCKGIIKNKSNNTFSYSVFHQVEIRLGANYPTMAPERRFITIPIFHPNVDEEGHICIGQWNPSLKLEEWVKTIGEMIQYKTYNNGNPLNIEAKKWTEENKNMFPIDNRSLINEVKPVKIKEGEHSEQPQMIIKPSEKSNQQVSRADKIIINEEELNNE